ncbi:hypothetical protein BDA96_08G164500 [Sorghum bicolor]|uniref:Dof zinc finger protein n=1 Tax=Sorghum bicolor TaxID=4558 RepID=A0A921QIL5_SORBI|nr:hypothetical protein BDA96_08G164500 [Sorghum bicolor]
MEAPLHQFPVPPPPPLPQDALLRQQAVAARALMMAAAAAAAAGNKAPPSSLSLAAAAKPGREQCPRCASRDTKFCYYNNYNTAQPRHFCRACRRYWTLGGSLRNVPVGGSTRKRPRPARHTRAMAAAAAAMATPSTTTTTTASAGGSPFASPATLQGVGGITSGLFLSSLLPGSVSSASSASPLLALAAAPLLEGRLGFDLGFGDAALGGGGGAHAADLPHHHQLPLGGGPPLLPWPAATTRILEGDRAETTTVFPFPPAGAVWQELAATAPVVEAAGLHHGGAPHLLL